MKFFENVGDLTLSCENAGSSPAKNMIPLGETNLYIFYIWNSNAHVYLKKWGQSFSMLGNVMHFVQRDEWNDCKANALSIEKSSKNFTTPHSFHLFTNFSTPFHFRPPLPVRTRPYI